MAGSLQLYTEAEHQGLRTYPMGSFTTTDLELGTDYAEDYKVEFNAPVLGRDIWAVKLTVYASGIQNLQVDKTYSPVPETQMIQDGTYLVPSNCDVTSPLLSARPADWDLHWRDKYNQVTYNDLPSGGTFNRVYNSNPIVAPSSFGTVYDPPFVADTYKQTDQGRYIFWTMSDIYFAIEAFWTYTNEYSGGPYGTRYAIRPFYSDTSSPNRAYSNCFRERGVAGAYCPSLSEQESLRISIEDFTQGANPVVPKVHINFINFNYDIEMPNHEIQTKQMIGFAIWRAGADGVPTYAQIAAFEKEFWEGLPEPPNDGPTSSPQGGHGTFSAPSDNRGDRAGATAAAIASAWNGNAITAGYNNYYVAANLTAPFTEMCEKLWDPDIIQSWINQATSPLQAVVTCHQIPANLAPSSLGTAETIKAAGMTLSSTAAPTFSQYVTSYHVGDIDISQYTDAFADFTNTSVYLHLPYIGTYQIDTAACMHGWLAVDYLCDVSSGHVTALVTTMDKFGNTEIRYEFKGDCSKTVPLYQRENPWSKVMGATLPALAGAGIAAVTGNAIGAMAISGAAANVMSGLDDYYGVDSGSFGNPEDIGVVRSLIGDSMRGAAGRSSAIGSALGSVGSSATSAALSGGGTVQSNASGGDVTSPIDTTCWVLITRPQWSAPELYDRERAYPSDISGTIGDFQGLLQVASCELNSIKSTDQELNEIDNWLKSGVLLD